MTKFVKGDRVQISAAWLARSQWAGKARRVRGGKWYDPKRSGTVKATPKGVCVTVHWDGNAESSLSHMHNSFLVHASGLRRDIKRLLAVES